jgi:hypothetical protein
MGAPCNTDSHLSRRARCTQRFFFTPKLEQTLSYVFR